MYTRRYDRVRPLNRRLRIAAFWLVLGGIHLALGFRDQGAVAYAATAAFSLLPQDPIFNPRHATNLRYTWFVLLIAVGAVALIVLDFDTAFWVVVAYYALSVVVAAVGILVRNLLRAKESSRL